MLQGAPGTASLFRHSVLVDELLGMASIQAVTRGLKDTSTIRCRLLFSKASGRRYSILHCLQTVRPGTLMIVDAR